MEENCLASELLYIKTILLVLSNAFFKSPKSIPISSKTVIISDKIIKKINNSKKSTKDITTFKYLITYQDASNYVKFLFFPAIT